MTRGLFISASGMLNEASRQDIVANNLANVNTSGYKRDIAISKAFPSVLLNRINDPRRIGKNFIVDPRPVVGRLGAGANFAETAHDFVAPANYQNTGNTLDLAILGDGFFTIQAPVGQAYTRNGNFVLNVDKMIVTTEGHLVLGEKGPIEVTGSEVDIDPNGNVLVDGEFVDRLQVVDFLKPYKLMKLGNSMFVPSDPNLTADPVENPTVRTGTLEMSNVSVVTEMVDLITITRAYQANQKVMMAQDATIGNAIQLARLGMTL